MLAVRGCASARGRLSTVLVGGRLSRNHPQFAIFLPTYILPHDLFCFWVPHVVRGSERWLLLLFGAGSVTRFCGLLSGHCVCEMVTIRMRVCLCFFLRASKKIGSFISVSIVIFGCRRHVSNAY